MQITPVGYITSKNNQNFGGKIYSNKTLDKYIGLLDEYKKAGNALQMKMHIASEATKVKLEETNELIKPLIDDDENFLWAITPARTKDKFARFVVDGNYAIIASSSPRHSWDKVIEMIHKRILTERPDTLTKEIQEIEPTIKEDSYIQKMKNLKGLLYKKQNHIKHLEDRKEDFAMDHYDTISKIEIKLINTIPFNNKSFRQVKTFLRELYHRAVEKQPELKEIYKNNYKKYYNNHQEEHTKLGRLKQQASMFGHSSVKDYLKYGSTNSNDIPF